MNPYENASINPTGSRGGNGSAYELFGNPLYTSAGQINPTGVGQSQGFGQQGFGQQNQPLQQNLGQQNPWQNQPQTNQPWGQNQFAQQNPYLSPNFAQAYGQPFNAGQQFNPQHQFNPQQQFTPQQFTPQQFNPMQQQFNPLQQMSPQMGTGQQTGVLTTKSIEVNVNVPAQRIIGKHPMEVQQYILQVVLPVLLDGLTKRAMASDVGHSITSDLRECVVRIEI